MKTFKQLVKEVFDLLGEDFSMAHAFGDENIKREKGQSATAHQQLIGVLENMPELDKKLLKQCGNVRSGELIGTCYKVFKHFKTNNEKCNNITYSPSDNTYSANVQKNYGSENKNLVSINKEYIANTIKANNKEFDIAIATIQDNLEKYSYGTYDLGQTISCKTQNFFTINGNKITIRVPADGGQNSTKGLDMYEEAKDFVTTIDKEDGYKCFKINNSDNFIFVSPVKKYGIFVISSELNAERPYLADPGFLQGIVRGLGDRTSVTFAKHANVAQNKKSINKNNVAKKPCIFIPSLLVNKAGSRNGKEALKWWQQLHKIAGKYGLAIKETQHRDLVDVPNKFYEKQEIGDIVDKVNNYLEQFISYQ